MKVWLESIDDGIDHYFMKDNMIYHIDLDKPIAKNEEDIDRILKKSIVSYYILKINPNVAIPIYEPHMIIDKCLRQKYHSKLFCHFNII